MEEHPAIANLSVGNQLAKLSTVAIGRLIDAQERTPSLLHLHLGQLRDPTQITRLEMVSVWLNANRRHDYNVPHTHTDSFLSGVFWVSVSEGAAESSELVLSDPRVQLQQFEYHDWFGMGLQRRIVPTPGKLVLWPSWLSHRVEPVADDAKPLESEQSERISVSFNLGFGPAEPRPNG